MNTENPRDELSELLSRELHRRTDGMHDAPLAFDDVRGQAASIRRRRRVATGLGVAAAVAVIVPTAMFATRYGDSSPQPATPLPTVTTPSASESPTSTPTMGPRPHALDVRDLPTGAAPAIGYLTADDESPLPYAYAVTAEATVRASTDGVLVDAGGTTFGPYPSSSGLARNAVGTAVAWVTEDGQAMTWQDGVPQPNLLATIGLAGPQVEAVTGDGCVNGKGAGDCAVFVRGSDDQGQPKSLKILGGAVDLVDDGQKIVQVRDAEESGRVLGSTDISDDGSCSAVLDGTETLLDTCDYQIDAFSPDGSYVLASEPYHSGIGSGVIAVFATVGDRFGYRVADRQHFAFYNNAVWEDDSHVLFSVYQDGMWSVVRMDVHGAMEYAVPPQPGNDMECPFVFETR